MKILEKRMDDPEYLPPSAIASRLSPAIKEQHVVVVDPSDSSAKINAPVLTTKRRSVDDSKLAI